MSGNPCNTGSGVTDVTNAMVDMCDVLTNPVANVSLQISGLLRLRAASKKRENP